MGLLVMILGSAWIVLSFTALLVWLAPPLIAWSDTFGLFIYFVALVVNGGVSTFAIQESVERIGA